MQIKELVPYERYPLGDARKRLTGAGYELAYGSTYTVKDIRKAVIDHQPALISISGRTYLAVGENPASLILHRHGKIREYSDHQLRKSFDGEAVIVQGRPSTQEGNELVIFAQERDNWPGEWMDMKAQAVRCVRGLQCGAPWLPDHPVILTFRKPTPAQVKDLIRASTIGIEITLYDPSDPVTEFLHELGHVYWTNRLTADEKKSFKDYQKTFKKGQVPPIYTSDYWWKNDEELFATLYMFCVKARTVNPGYVRLLDLYESRGRDLVEGIFSRVEAEQSTRQSWEAGLPALQECIERCLHKTYRVAGTRRIIKARSPLGHIPDGIRFDRTVKHRVLDKAKDLEWIKIEDGPLSGHEIALKAGVVHPFLTKAAIRSRAQAPVKAITATVSINGQEYKTYRERGPLPPVPPDVVVTTARYWPPRSGLLQKAKNMAHLVKKVITNKIGRRQTVWIRPDEPEQAPSTHQTPVSHHALPQEPSAQHIFEAHRPEERDTTPLTPEADKLKGEILASGINLNYEHEWTNSNTISLLGQKVKTKGDLAHLAQVYRNPQFETMRIFMMNDSNEVVLETGISCRLPGCAAAFIRPEDQAGSMLDMKAKMQAAKATKYYILHNHPSGEPKPSSNDLQVTNFYNQNLPGFQGHVIIDHDRYVTIDARGQQAQHDINPEFRRGAEYLTPSMAHAAIGQSIGSPYDLMDIAKTHQILKDYFVTLIGSSKGTVRGIMNIPAASFLGDGSPGLQQAHDFSVKVGAQDMFAVGIEDNEAMATAIKNGMERGYFRDMVTKNGSSIMESGKYRKLPRYESGMNVLDAAQVSERSATFTKARLVRDPNGKIILKSQDRRGLPTKVITNVLGHRQTVHYRPDDDTMSEGKAAHNGKNLSGQKFKGVTYPDFTIEDIAAIPTSVQPPELDEDTVKKFTVHNVWNIYNDNFLKSPVKDVTGRVIDFNKNRFFKMTGLNQVFTERAKELFVNGDDQVLKMPILPSPVLTFGAEPQGKGVGNSLYQYNISDGTRQEVIKRIKRYRWILDTITNPSVILHDRMPKRERHTQEMYLKKYGDNRVVLVGVDDKKGIIFPITSYDINKSQLAERVVKKQYGLIWKNPRQKIKLKNKNILKAITYQDLVDILQDVNTDPTDAQKEAGNYKKASFSWNGLKITIENPAGSTRSGVSPDGEPWESDMHHHYGYVNRSEGADGDHVDVFIGPAMDTADTVYVVHQVDQESREFDEHKCMIGFNTQDEAQEAYMKHYPDDWPGMGEVVPLPVNEFKAWIQEGDTTAPAPRFKELFQKAKSMISKKILLPALTALVITRASTKSKHTL